MALVVVAMLVVLGMIAWPDDDRATGKNGGRLVGDEFKCPMRCGVAWRSRNGDRAGDGLRRGSFAW